MTKGGEYEFADEISSARESMMSRNVTFKFPESNGLENTYIVPIDKPVQLALLEYGAYSDEACTTVWEETPADSNGFYADEVIYLKRSVDSQNE